MNRISPQFLFDFGSPNAYLAHQIIPDIEKRTGLLRCYLSRVENGHTVPSLDTLAKIATAMDLPLAQFFNEGNGDNGSKSAPHLAEDEVRFLTQIRRYSSSLNDSDRKLVIAMVKKMAAPASR